MKTGRLYWIIGVGLLVVVVFAALSHGAVLPWSGSIFTLLMLVLGLLWAIKCVVDKKVRVRVPSTFWPLAAFFAYGLVQCIATTGPDGRVSSLSVDVEATRQTVLVLFVLILGHLIATNFFATERSIQFLVKVLVIFGFGLALTSLIQYFTKENIFHWSKPDWAVSYWLSGPFVNHNHFAGYMELLIPIPVALIATGAVKQSRVLYGFAAAIMAISVIFSVSRGGMISTAVGLVFVAGAGFNYLRLKTGSTRAHQVDDRHQSFFTGNFIRGIAAVVLIAISIVVGVLWLGADPVVDRFSESTIVSTDEKVQDFEGSRGWIWKNTYYVFKSNPLFGTGMGSFTTAFPKYAEGYEARPDGHSWIWARSHNDYLQILADTGVIGGIIAIWFIVATFLAIRRGLSIPDKFRAGLVIGVGAAVLSLLVHSIFDFNLQLPSTSLLFLVWIGVASNAVYPTEDYKTIHET